MRLPIKVQCIVFRKKEGKIEFLLLKTVETRGGYWQSITGGYKESDISLFTAAKRELNEETGIEEKNILASYEKIHTFQFKGIHKLIHTEFVFGFEVNSEVEVNLANQDHIEHTEYQWCTYEQAIKLLFHDSSKESLKALMAKI